MEKTIKGCTCACDAWHYPMKTDETQQIRRLESEGYAFLCSVRNSATPFPPRDLGSMPGVDAFFCGIALRLGV
jgi:hypothetical protein